MRKAGVMRKGLALLLGVTMAFSAVACGNGGKDAAEEAGTKESEAKTTVAGAAEGTTAPGAEGEEVELIVFAAASMTETLSEIAENYKAVAPNVKITFNFDSSGTLKTQIEQGADCDVFISAAQKQMNQLDIEADPEVNKDGLDFVKQGTRIDLLENKVVLVTPDGNPAGIEAFQDITSDKLNLICLGNDDVPVGAYSLKILDYLGTSAEELEKANKITYGSNVKEVTTQVKEATVDCGIIYATDAFSAGLTPVAEATAEMCGQVIYPAAVLNTTENEAEAQAFLDYLATDECAEVFEGVGFTALKK